ncbi:hypothetical protein [Streptomyces sp. NPDC002763]|uniref:hypothetical protein n=1 Tax=Streptomyces sp. NPDC002763 TaxID=3154427 RepID=UPI0033207D8B
MTFDQSSWRVENSRIYNIAGSLHLTEESGPREFAEAVAEVRSRLQALENVSEAERSAIDEELAEAESLGEDAPGATEDGDGSDEGGADAEGSADADTGGRIVRALSRARALLSAATGAATAASELGDSVGSLAHWAEQHL